MQASAFEATRRRSGRSAAPPHSDCAEAVSPSAPARPSASCACGGSCPRCQAKSHLTIGEPGDAYEREADAVADRVMRMPGGEVPVRPASSTLQRKCAACEKEDEDRLLQPKAESSSASVQGEVAIAPSSVDSALSSPGEALDFDTRAFFEPRFGRDFSGVRVHSGTAAEHSARELNATAYTVGHDIVLGAGRFAPGIHEGRRLIAHELTHVVQQSYTHGNGAGRSDIKGTLASRCGSARLQRSCADGNCDTCARGRKDFWITVFFRRRATRDTMTKLRAQINGAKAILANCCLNLKFDFNWTLLPGGGSLPAFEGDPAGEWHFTAQEQDLGEGTTFSGARGIPMLLIDDVPLSGGGVTVDPRFDTTYTGRSYFGIGINQTTTPNPNCNHIAHELWHVGSGLSAHDPANGTVTSCAGAGVSLAYCDGLRALV